MKLYLSNANYVGKRVGRRQDSLLIFEIDTSESNESFYGLFYFTVLYFASVCLNKNYIARRNLASGINILCYL